MTALSIDVTGLPPGTPVAAEIATSAGDIREAVVVAGRAFVSEVPSGTYVVRLVAPGSGRASAVVTVAEGAAEAASVAFEFAAPDAAWEGAPVFEVASTALIQLLSILGRHGRAARTMPPDDALTTAEQLPGPALFVRDATRTLLAPVALRDTYTVRRGAEGGRPVHLCVTAGPGTARFVALPPHSVARIRCAPESGGTPTVSVRPTDVDARALLDFNAAARISAALTITPHIIQTVGERISHGEGDAVAGCAVAHHLMSNPRRQWAQEWIHALAEAFPASPDVAVLAAWHGIAPGSPGSTAEAPDLRELLIAASDPVQGLPVYLQSLQLLRAAVERTKRADSAAGAWDPRLEEALRRTQHYLSAAEPSEVFTSFTGRGPFSPRSPGPDQDIYGTQTQASTAALANALTSLGSVRSGRQQSVTGDSLTLAWSRGPGTGTVSLSLTGPARSELAGTPLALVRTDNEDVELTRVSVEGRAVFTLPHGATGRLLVPDETQDPPAVLVPPLPTRHAAAAGPETSRRVASQVLEYVVEPVRGRNRWRVTARCSANGPKPLWALVRQRSADNEPYLTFALPLRWLHGSWRESALLLGRASQQLDWYAAPEPVSELPSRSAPLILERSLDHAADAWTSSALGRPGSRSLGMARKRK